MSENQNEDLVWKTDGRDWGQGHRQYKATVAKGYYVAAPCYDWVSKELLRYEVYYYLSPGKQRYVGRDGSLDKAKVIAQADWDTGTANKRTPDA